MQLLDVVWFPTPISNEVCDGIMRPGPSYDTGLTNDTFCDDYCVTDLCDKFTQYLFARNNWLQWQRKTGLWCDYNISICDQRCISPWLLLLSCKVWLLLMGWPMACDPSRPMSHAGHPPSVVTCPGHLAPGANGLNSLQTSAALYS